LVWGNSGADEAFKNFTRSSQRAAFGGQLASPAGWENLCSYSVMSQFITGAPVDEDHCAITNRNGYLQGCAAGFYQPLYDATTTPRPCPDGFFCPQNYGERHHIISLFISQSHILSFPLPSL